MEDGGTAVADGEGAGHVAELADRRVGQDPLDVVLGERGEAGAGHGDGGHHGEDHHRGLGRLEHRQETGDEVDPGGHHRRGVDQRRDGCRARHRVGEPGVQRELRGLAGHAREQQQGDQGRVVDAAARHGPQDAGDAERSGVRAQGEQADEERHVAELGDQEGLQGGGAGLGGLPVVADEEVGADAHDFPADQQHDQVAGVDDQEHRGGEQGDEGRVRGVARVVAQVARRVDLHAGRDEGDQDGDERGEAVDVQGQVDRYRAGRGQLGVGLDGRASALAHGDQRGQRERGQGRKYGERADESGGGAAQEQAGRGAQERQKGDENGEGGRGHAVASAFSAAEVSVPGPSVSSPWPSAVSRSLSMSEVPRLR